MPERESTRKRYTGAAVDVSFADETMKADLTRGIASWLATDVTTAEPATA